MAGRAMCGDGELEPQEAGPPRTRETAGSMRGFHLTGDLRRKEPPWGLACGILNKLSVWIKRTIS